MENSRCYKGNERDSRIFLVTRSRNSNNLSNNIITQRRHSWEIMNLVLRCCGGASLHQKKEGNLVELKINIF